MKAIDASENVNEKEVYSNLQDTRRRYKPQFQLGQLVRTADIEKVFHMEESANWSYKLYTITKKIHDTIPSNKINYLPESYKEILLRSTKVSLEEINKVMKKQDLNH